MRERAEAFYQIPFSWRRLYRRKSEKIIAGEKELPEKKEKVSDQKVVKSEKRKFDLVVDI